MIKASNSHSLTDFQRNARSMIEGINESKEPLMLTVNGKVQAVLIDPQTYDAVAEKLEHDRMVQGIKEAMEQVKRGEVKPLDTFVKEMKAKYDL